MLFDYIEITRTQYTGMTQAFCFFISRLAVLLLNSFVCLSFLILFRPHHQRLTHSLTPALALSLSLILLSLLPVFSFSLSNFTIICFNFLFLSLFYSSPTFLLSPFLYFCSSRLFSALFPCADIFHSLFHFSFALS